MLLLVLSPWQRYADDCARGCGGGHEVDSVRPAVEGWPEPAAATLVDELVQAGFVTRGQDPHDRRRYALELTDAGRARLPDIKAAMAQVETELRGLLGGDGIRDLRTLLLKLLDGAVPME